MKKFAVFDIDGTLVRWQLYHALVDTLAKNDALDPDAHTLIHQARMRWKNREHGYNFQAYEMELIKQFESAVTKLDPKLFDRYVEQVIDEYKDQIYTYTKTLVGKLKDQGYILLAISGSHEELVARIADHYGFDDYIGTRYSKNSTGFTGDVTVASHNKAEQLNKLVEKHHLSYKESYAVGDSKSDAAMLELVENPIAFNPDQNLYKIAQEKHWPIVVERKNVIYKLDYKDGSYLLA